MMKRGAIVLCGGQSRRMGSPKANLPFGPELMLQRVVRLVAEVVTTDRIVVVAAPQQDVPDLPDDIQLTCDRREGMGPLEGLASGIRALQDRADAVYATSCDAPLLVPAFVQRMFDELGECDVAVPKDGKFYHPLSAVYRTTVLATIEKLLDADRLRPVALFEEVATRDVPVGDLCEVDPELSTLQNLNTPEDYQQALKRAGL